MARFIKLTHWENHTISYFINPEHIAALQPGNANTLVILPSRQEFRVAETADQIFQLAGAEVVHPYVPVHDEVEAEAVQAEAEAEVEAEAETESNTRSNRRK